MLVFILFYVVLVESKGGIFYAQPTFVENYPNDFPDIVESFFYLQQTSKWSVRFNGELHVKQTLGPMMGQIQVLAWSGREFKKPSGGLPDDSVINLCAVGAVVRIFEKLEPRSGFDDKMCTFAAGNYTNSVDYDEHLHEMTQLYTYGPARVILTITNEHGDKTYFGFMLQLDFYDLNLHKFLPKD